MDLIINLTPHPILIEGCSPIMPSGEIARAKEIIADAPSLGDFPCTYQEFGEIIGLPEYQKNVFYIVSLPIWNALPERSDLLLSGQQVRDESGKIVGCKSLVRRNKH